MEPSGQGHLPGILALLACLSLLLFSHVVQADDDEEDGTAIVGPECDLCSLLDVPRDFLSDNFMKMSDRLDVFFSNSQTYEELDKSYAELSVNAVVEGKSMPTYYSDTRVFLELPRTQQRLNLMFQAESNSELDTDNPDITPGSPDQQTNALVLRGDISKRENWRIYADIGTENRGYIDPFIRFTYLHNFDGKKWNWTWKEAIFRFSTRGNGVTSGLRFDRPIEENYHFRFSNQLIWYQNDNFYDRAHSLNLYQYLEHKNALAYALGLYTTSDPVDSVYFVQLKYKKLIHKTWLFYEIIPEVLYKQSTSYSATPRLTLKLDIMLGNF